MIVEVGIMASNNSVGQYLVLSYGSHSLVLVLKAYFDESGDSKDPNCKVVAVAGALSSLELWGQFEPLWKECLSNFGVSELHMKHFAHSNGEYEGWEEDKRQNFLGSLLEIANRHIDLYVGYGVSLEAFRNLSSEKQRYLGDPYYVCLQYCFHQSLIHAHEMPPQEQVELFRCRTTFIHSSFRPIYRQLPFHIQEFQDPLP